LKTAEFLPLNTVFTLNSPLIRSMSLQLPPLPPLHGRERGVGGDIEKYRELRRKGVNSEPVFLNVYGA
jgi:hypothetical protein